MSASGDEKKTVDTKAAIAANKQQKQEIAKQEAQAAAALKKPAVVTTKVFDIGEALTKAQSDLDKAKADLAKISTSQASSKAKIKAIETQKEKIAIEHAKIAELATQRELEKRKDVKTTPYNAPPDDRKETQPTPKIGKTATVTVGSILKLNEDYGTKKRGYEKQADYGTTIGLNELTGPNRVENINKVKARFAHMAMASAESFAKTLPLAALGTVGGAGGAVVVGLMGAATAVSLINPVNRQALDQFVTEHPQEFMASLAGAVLAGVSVVEVRGALREYTKNMKLNERLAFEKKWDELIDDVNFKEQIKGSEFPSNIDKRQQALNAARAKEAAEKIINDPAYLEQFDRAEFPSRAVEIPTKNGEKIWVYDNTNPDDLIVYNMVRNSNDPEWVVKNFWNDAKASNMALWFDDTGTGVFDTVTVPELLNQYPGLKEPYINPALLDPNVVNRAGIVGKNPSTWFNPATLDPSLFNKADIVARLGTTQPSMMTVALAVYASQGYITKEQLDALITANQVHINALEELGVQIPSDYTDASLREKGLTDVVQEITEITDVIEDTPDPTPTPPPPPEPTPPPTEPTPPPTEPTPPTPKPTPPTEPSPTETPPLKLSLKEKEERKIMNLKLFNGPRERYRVKFTYPRGGKEVITVEARSFPEAVNRAQMARKPNKYPPSITDVVRSQ